MDKMVLNVVCVMLSMMLMFLSGGCASTVSKSPDVMVAKYVSTPIKIDGELDDMAWENAEVYEMFLSEDKYSQGEQVKEKGQVSFTWDDNYFYMAISFDDTDIVAKGQGDQLHHYSLGDLAELFLKPANSSWYWELYVTPAGRKTTFWLPERLVLNENYKCGLMVAAKFIGTINDPTDSDLSWTAEMAMPIKDLTAFGDSFYSGFDWRILVGRYNHIFNLEEKDRELTMSPKLSRTNFHLLDEYATLRLIK